MSFRQARLLKAGRIALTTIIWVMWLAVPLWPKPFLPTGDLPKIDLTVAEVKRSEYGIDLALVVANRTQMPLYLEIDKWSHMQELHSVQIEKQQSEHS